MIARLPSLSAWALLLLALVLSPVLGLLTPYAALLILLPLFIVTLVRRDAKAAYASYDARVFLGAFVLFAVVCAITADSASDALRGFNFTMFLVYGAAALLFERHRSRSPAELVAQLAGLGTVLGLVQVIVGAVLLQQDRPQALNLGPIELSNALLALGFISMGGLFVRRDRLGWLYLLPPLFAIAATLITASRGPLLGIPVAVIVAAAFIRAERFRNSVRATLIGAAGLLLMLAVGVVAVLQGRAGSILNIVGAVAEGQAVVDETTRQRFVLYRAGWQSFAQSPWVGHGWGNVMSSVQPFVPASDQSLLTWLPQLHNDVLNFAVASGVIGVVAYLTIVTAPIVGALFSPPDSLRTFRLYGASVLTIVYVGGGLTDLMFGFEFHTYLFAMLTAILLHFCRERAP